MLSIFFETTSSCIFFSILYDLSGMHISDFQVSLPRGERLLSQLPTPMPYVVTGLISSTKRGICPLREERSAIGDIQSLIHLQLKRGLFPSSFFKEI